MTDQNENHRGNNQPLVSVIVPVYNVEQYIEKCVRSIMQQDYECIEIILVDDGTQDASGQIIDKLALKDSRIRVIHKENAGVSSARNSGLAVATGEYIAFVDGDDHVEQDYISYLVGLAVNNGCHMAISRYNFTSYNKTQIAVDHQTLVSAEQVIEELYLMSLNVAVWNKLYRHSFLKENGLLFDERIWYGEGMLFNIECLQYVDKVVLGEKKVYYQVSNPNSAMRKFNLESNFCGIRSLEIQKEKSHKWNQSIEDAWIYHYRCFSDSILNGLVRTSIVEDNKDIYRKCIKNLRSDILVPLRVNIPIKRKAYYLVAAVCPVLLAKRNAWKTRREWRRLSAKESLNYLESST